MSIESSQRRKQSTDPHPTNSSPPTPLKCVCARLDGAHCCCQSAMPVRAQHSSVVPLSQVLNNYMDQAREREQDSEAKRLYFADGKRKVDYVLVYNYRRRASSRGSPGQHRLSIISNGSFAMGLGGKDAEEERKAEHEEVAVDLGPLDPAEGDKKMVREEFEACLIEAGLEIERDKEVW